MEVKNPKFSCSDIPDKPSYQEISLSIKSSCSTFPGCQRCKTLSLSLPFYNQELNFSIFMQEKNQSYKLPEYCDLAHAIKSEKQGSIIVRFVVFVYLMECVCWPVQLPFKSKLKSCPEKDSGASVSEVFVGEAQQPSECMQKQHH